MQPKTQPQEQQKQETLKSERRNIFLFDRKIEHEVREDQSTKAKNLVIRGYAIVFNDPVEIYDAYYGKFTETITRDSLTTTDLSKVYLLWNHDTSLVLGRSDVNLRLEVDDKGLFYEAVLPNTQSARDAYNLLEAGIVDGMSMGFHSEDFIDRSTGNRIIKTINDLYEISIVPFPAYEDTVAMVKREIEKQSTSKEDNRSDDAMKELNLKILEEAISDMKESLDKEAK